MERQEIADNGVGCCDRQISFEIAANIVQMRCLIDLGEDLVSIGKKLPAGGGKLHALRRADEKRNADRFFQLLIAVVTADCDIESCVAA